jgi:hypothetical protein
LVSQVNDQHEAEVREFLSSFKTESGLQALMGVWSMLASRATSASGLERVAANLAVLEFGQQLERIFSEIGGSGEQEAV